MSNLSSDTDFRLLGNDSELPIGSINVCRICELSYVVGSIKDAKIHHAEHEAILKGSLPKEIRELLKMMGWKLARNNDELMCMQEQSLGEEEILLKNPEIGKRAIVFSKWCRARDNGLSDLDFETYMYDHFAFVEAVLEKDSKKAILISKAIARWEQYNG
jgi:hypothetical protein